MMGVLIALGVGALAGIIDILPMIIKKMDRYAICSAFVQWVVLGVIIQYARIAELSGWINGALIAVLAALPIVILVAKDDRKSVGIILANSLVLGALLGYILTKY